jgi:hypothetical protein
MTAAFAKLVKTACHWDYSTVQLPALDGSDLSWPRDHTLAGPPATR